MTRGTFYLLLPSKILESCEFNGDMYGSPKDDLRLQGAGNYSLAIQLLKNVEGDESFEKMVKDFDRQAEFNYQDEENGYFGVFERSWESKINLAREIDFNKKDYFDKFFSDYLYFKNLSGENVRFRTKYGEEIILSNGKIATFYFGDFIEII